MIFFAYNKKSKHYESSAVQEGSALQTKEERFNSILSAFPLFYQDYECFKMQYNYTGE